MSARLSYSLPKSLSVLVSRATRPSSPSITIATKTATAAFWKLPSMAATTAKKPANSAAVVSRFGSR